ncbi:hypothetical protein PTTG_28560 [Puccinia triticina 1-1 BBBD Race 1]|uniref:Uncharacterized protein n=1 Tax=Puccinia triticina (isolate 1-1 / race 1 (BBBD)) TaxID=630390 RepID=A0A180GAU0_PUCT1|nr:hypothetical protein PTTG_28560 [Puccinia triticina 1-1 BBBD Race 1]
MYSGSSDNPARRIDRATHPGQQVVIASAAAQDEPHHPIPNTLVLHHLVKRNPSPTGIDTLLHPSQPARTAAREERQTDRTDQGPRQLHRHTLPRTQPSRTPPTDQGGPLKEPEDPVPPTRTKPLSRCEQVIKLPEKPCPSKTISSKLSDTFNILNQQSPSSSYEPSETVLLNSLSSAAQEYHLLHGSINTLLLSNPQQLRERLEKFWSVWLWRWNVGKTGCGAIDFNELFGGLQSPFLESPKMPRAPVDLFARFINEICPGFSVLPILIHDRKVVHMPSPTGLIKQEDIQSLLRYLLSLLEGSEAKRAQARPVAQVSVVDQEQNVIMKRLSGFDFGTLATFQPKLVSTTSSAIQPAGAWARRALKWASASLVLPSFDNIENESESLDQLLRADIGLAPRTSPPRLVRIKSSLADPEIVTEAISSPTRAGLSKVPTFHCLLTNKAWLSAQPSCDLSSSPNLHI